MLTIFGFSLFFAVGYMVGMMVENDHHKQKQMRMARKRHPVGSTIEQQMQQDGWKI
jgi:hypothetical protein